MILAERIVSDVGWRDLPLNPPTRVHHANTGHAMLYTPSVLLSALCSGGWVGLNRQWIVDDSELARCVRWAAAKTEWREDAEAPVGWFHATCAEMADALGWGRTKAHSWMHDSDLFEARTDGRRGTLMRLRIDVREGIPARLRIPPLRRRCEQNREQSKSAQVTDNTCIFRHAQAIREQNREQSQNSPLHPPYKEEEEHPVELPPTTHAQACEGRESRAPFAGEWASYLRAPVSEGTVTVLAFTRPPVRETLRWLAQVGLRYDRSRSEWKGVLGCPDARGTIDAACRLDAQKEANAAATVRALFWASGDNVWSTQGKVEADVRMFLLSHGGVELAEATRDAFGAHPGRWLMPEHAARLFEAPVAVPALSPPPMPVVMQVAPVEDVAPAPPRPAEVTPMAQQSPRIPRCSALWCQWLAACVALGLLNDVPREAPVLRNEAEARIDLCQRIATYRGERVTFATIERIERETLNVFQDKGRLG